MMVTRDVILDLLPLYFAGQVSADTKALVDEFLRTDPDFARMSHRFDALLKEGRAPSEPDATERRAFERTRMLLRYRNQSIGVAVAYSLLPFAFVIRHGEIEWLFRGRPVIAVTFALTAVACWVAAYAINWKAHREV